MTDSIGPIVHASSASGAFAAVATVRAELAPAANQSIHDAVVARVQATIDEARVLGAAAEQAVAAARAGAGTENDVEGVLLATRKADAAFRMLEAARNAMLEAYARLGDLR